MLFPLKHLVYNTFNSHVIGAFCIGFLQKAPDFRRLVILQQLYWKPACNKRIHHPFPPAAALGSETRCKCLLSGFELAIYYEKLIK